MRCSGEEIEMESCSVGGVTQMSNVKKCPPPEKVFTNTQEREVMESPLERTLSGL